MFVIFSLISGILAATLTGVIKALRRRKPVGVLLIDTSDPDGPYMFLELSEDVSTILKAKRVTFEVDAREYISQR